MRASAYTGSLSFEKRGQDRDAIFALLERGVIRVALAVEKEQAGRCPWRMRA